MNSQQMAVTLLRGMTDFTHPDGTPVSVRKLLVSEDGNDSYLLEHHKQKLTQIMEQTYEAISRLRTYYPEILPEGLTTPDLTDAKARKAFNTELKKTEIFDQIELASMETIDKLDVEFIFNPSHLIDGLEFMFEGCAKLQALGEAVSSLARTGKSPSSECMADGIQVIELLQMTSQVDDRITTAVEHAMNEHTQPAITLEILRDNLTKIAKAIETEKGAEGSISPP